MADTRSEIMRLANELIRSIGYHSFSYTDISKQLDIKNAAIHYYFPAKSDLGIEVIRRNKNRFIQRTEEWKGLTCKEQYTKYITMHDSFRDASWTCIVGSLSPTYDILPESMRTELTVLINTIFDWLTDLLEKGKANGEFTFREKPRDKAYQIHSSLLASLLMNRFLKNDIYYSIQKSLLDI